MTEYLRLDRRAKQTSVLIDYFFEYFSRLGVLPVRFWLADAIGDNYKKMEYSFAVVKKEYEQ